MSSANSSEFYIGERAEKAGSKLRKRPRGRPRAADRHGLGVIFGICVMYPAASVSDDLPLIPCGNGTRVCYQTDTHVLLCPMELSVHVAFRRRVEPEAARVCKAHKEYAEICADFDAEYLAGGITDTGELKQRKLNHAAYRNLHDAVTWWGMYCTWGEVRALPYAKLYLRECTRAEVPNLPRLPRLPPPHEAGSEHGSQLHAPAHIYALLMQLRWPGSYLYSEQRPTQVGGQYGVKLCRPSECLAHCIGWALADWWRAYPQEALRGTLRIPRGALLSDDLLFWVMETYLQSSDPKRALQVWRRALMLLHKLGIIAMEGDEMCSASRETKAIKARRRGERPETKPQGGQFDWLQEPITLLPNTKKCRFLDFSAEL